MRALLLHAGCNRVLQVLVLYLAGHLTEGSCLASHAPSHHLLLPVRGLGGCNRSLQLVVDTHIGWNATVGTRRLGLLGLWLSLHLACQDVHGHVKVTSRLCERHVGVLLREAHGHEHLNVVQELLVRLLIVHSFVW